MCVNVPAWTTITNRHFFIFSEWWQCKQKTLWKTWITGKLCSWQHIRLGLYATLPLWGNGIRTTGTERWSAKMYPQAGAYMHCTWQVLATDLFFPTSWERKHWTYEITLKSLPVCPLVYTLQINCPCSARSHWSRSPCGPGDKGCDK